MRIRGTAEILVFPISQLHNWLLSGCKNSQKGPRAILFGGQSGNATGPTRRFHEPGHMGCRAVALPNSVRLIPNRGNLACCPDFKASHYHRTGAIASQEPTGACCAQVRKDRHERSRRCADHRRGRVGRGRGVESRRHEDAHPLPRARRLDEPARRTPARAATGRRARFGDYSPSPNIRARPEDYPINDDNSPIKVVNFNGVGGGTVMYTAHFPRLHPSDFRVRSLDGVADDWPIDYDTLVPFFEENDRMMGVSGPRRRSRRSAERTRRCRRFRSAAPAQCWQRR